METTIDEVVIEINSKADKANSGLKGLEDTIDSLMSKLGNGIKKLKDFSQNISNFTQSINGIQNINTDGIKTLGENLTPISQIGKSTNLKNMLEQLRQIPEVTKELDTETIKEFISKMKELSDALSPLAKDLLIVGNAFKTLPSGIKNVSSAVDKLHSKTNKIKNTNDTFKNLYKTMGSLGIIAGISKIGSLIGKAVNLSNEYVENLNLFKISMGETEKEAGKFVDKFSKVLGVDPSNVMRYMGMFNNLAKGFGISSDKAYLMSKNLTQLSYDMSSFLNIPIDQAMQKIKSGFSGEIEPMRAVGVALDQATLQETAYSLGIKKKVSEMTRAQKTELLYYQMIKRTNTMQGDMARTLIQPANALRVMKQQFTQLARAIGNIFIPIIMKVIPYVMVLTKWLTNLAQSIANFLGFKIDTSAWENLGDISAGIDDIGDSANSTTKAMKEMLGPFDELNVIDFGKDSGSGNGIVSGGSLGIELPQYDALSGAINKNLQDAEENLKKIIPYLETIGIIFGTWKIGSSVINFLDKIGLIKDFSSSLKKTLGFGILISSAWLEYKGVKKILEDGLNIDTIINLISSTGGAFLGTYLLTGNLKISLAIAAFVGAFNLGLMIGEWLKEKYKDRIKYYVKTLDIKIDEKGITVDSVGKISGAITFILMEGISDGIKKVNKWIENNPIISNVIKSFINTFLTPLTGGLNQIIGPIFNFGFDAISQIGAGAKAAAEGKLPQYIQSILLDMLLKVISPITSWLRRNFGTMGEKIADAIDGGLRSKQQELQKALEETVDGARNAANNSLKVTGNNVGLTISSGLNQSINNNQYNLQKAIEETTNKSFVNSQANTNRTAYNSGSTLLTNLKNGANSQQSNITSTFTNIQNNGLNSSQFNTNKTAYNVGSELATNIQNGAISQQEAVTSTLLKLEKSGFINSQVQANTTAFNSGISLVTNIQEGIKFKDLTETIKNTANNGFTSSQADINRTAYNSGTNLMSNLQSGILSNKSNLTTEASTIGQDIGKKLGDNISDNMKVNGNTLGKTLNSALNSSIGKIKRNNTGLFGTGGLLSGLLNFTFSFFEDGGFPGMGEMFVARENGPELVGRIGNKTTVANNDQIVSGIKQGVKEAMLESNGGQQQRGPTNVYIGNRKVYSGYGSYANSENNMYGTNVIKV